MSLNFARPEGVNKSQMHFPQNKFFAVYTFVKSSMFYFYSKFSVTLKEHLDSYYSESVIPFLNTY